ncbi:MAG: FHA domain-containing protein [Deltaproteobacteria bacterium]|nr:FHA domain-containing protein [Deltaproteobacteria bacterium]
MTSRERRKHVRIQRQFEARLLNAKFSYETEGLTQNISQSGVYVKTRDWRLFQSGDQAIVTLFLPPSFTDRDKIFGLRGNAIVRRVDKQNEGVALEFSRDFQEFEKVDHSELALERRYKEISHYLRSFSDLEFADLIRANPHGFLVNKSKNELSSNAVFQFNTLSLDDDHAMQVIKRDFSIDSVHKATVMEVRKRKFDTAKNTITVGRAATNDIVIYDNLVSKSHAYLYLHPSGQGCYLVDCGSKNGTLLNGKVLKSFVKYKIVDCDEICFGPQTTTVYFSSISFANFISELRTAHPLSDS